MGCIAPSQPAQASAPPSCAGVEDHLPVLQIHCPVAQNVALAGVLSDGGEGAESQTTFARIGCVIRSSIDLSSGHEIQICFNCACLIITPDFRILDNI